MAYMFSDLMDKTVFVDFQFSLWETKRSGPDYASDVALAVDTSEFPLECGLDMLSTA